MTEVPYYDNYAASALRSVHTEQELMEMYAKRDFDLEDHFKKCEECRKTAKSSIDYDVMIGRPVHEDPWWMIR